MDMQKKSLAEKMISVMKECSYIEKDGTNSFHKYKYVSSNAVLQKVNDALVNHRVASFTRTRIISAEVATTNKGAQEKFVTAEAIITLVNADASEDKMEISAIGSGQDAGDKAVAKAQTMAIKYAWTMTLNISTGDDPEKDEQTDRSTSAAQSFADEYEQVYTKEQYQNLVDKTKRFISSFSAAEATLLRNAAQRAQARIAPPKEKGMM